MKAIILLFIIGFSLSYDRNAAISYARKYCSNYNSNYQNYQYDGGDCANFVSQCMIAGGMDFRSCSVSWIDDYGCLPKVRDLKLCLQQKGWKHSTTRPASFKAGYPIFSTTSSHVMLATGIDGNKIIFCGHNIDRCNATISSDIEYYYE